VTTSSQIDPVLGADERRLLHWLGEQKAARIDQLEAVLECDGQRALRTVAGMCEAGLAEISELLVGEPAWVFATRRGLRLAGSGFKLWRGRPWMLAHVGEINEVRLHIQRMAPESEWICERKLWRERQRGEHLPDGVVVTDGRRVAIEVELHLKSRAQTTAIVDELTSRFDAVVYFCARQTYWRLLRYRLSGQWPTLQVRGLPSEAAQEDRR